MNEFWSSLATGSVSPASVRIRSLNHLQQLIRAAGRTFTLAGIVALSWTVGLSVLFVESAIRFVHPSLHWVSVGWAVVQSVATAYAWAVVCVSLAYFVILCQHMAMRFKRLNAMTYGMTERSGVIPVSRRNEFLAEVIFEHDRTAYELHAYNHIWSTWLLVMYGASFPLGFWLVHTALFAWASDTVRAFLWLSFAQLLAITVTFIRAGDSVSHQVHLSLPLFT